MLALAVVVLPALVVAERGAQECTTALFAGAATADGRPILWKNRDTDRLSNKVVFVDERPFSYLGVVNADDADGRMVWAGLNAAGFAIANSVAYNLPQRSGEQVDLEGLIMADALRACATIGDFERRLSRELGPDLGSRANFLVMDAQGGASIFEVHNHGFKRLDAAGAARHYLANTNFSRSGTPDAGRGYLRFLRAETLLAAAPPESVTPAWVLQVAARDLEHPLLAHPRRTDWHTLAADKPYWIHTNHTINRASTASTIVVHGVKPGEDPRRAMMWVILGEPVTSVAVPLWVAAGMPPAPLWEGDDAALARQALRIKDRLRPLPDVERKEYLDLSRLDNVSGTGWLPRLLAAERETLTQATTLAERNASAAELSAFEKAAADRALALLQGIR